MKMVTAILTHEVKDFTNWKQKFDADETNRAKMDVKITGVFRAVENPNMVTVVSEIPTMEAAQGFLQNPELKATMEQAGVIGQPDVKILNKW